MLEPRAGEHNVESSGSRHIWERAEGRLAARGTGEPYEREDYGRQFNNTQTEEYLS